MDDQRVKLPALIVPPAGYDLIDAYARSKKLSKSEAIRQLLADSPNLKEFAAREGFDLGSLAVKSWGGQPREDRSED